MFFKFHRHYYPGRGGYTTPAPLGVAGGGHFYASPPNPPPGGGPFGLECGDDDKHKDDPPEEDPNKNKPQKGPGALANPPEEPPPGSPLSKDEAFDKAAAVRDAKLAGLDGLSGKQRNKVSTVVGAC